MSRAAFFDVDRTLVRVNTGAVLARWSLKHGETTLREFMRVMRWIGLYHLGLVDALVVKEKLIGLLVGLEESRFREVCHEVYVEQIRPHITDHARREVSARQQEGWICVVLSASTPYFSEPIAKEFGIEHVLCTRLVVESGKFTGAYLPPFCYGRGKVEAAEQWAKAHAVDLAQSAFFSDSISDLPMLQRVGEPRVINPDPRLRMEARRSKWPVEHWR